MKIVKMFERQEIDKELNIDFLDYCNYNCISFCNDVAIPWFVEHPSEYNDYNDETFIKINDYFLNHGAYPEEDVWIDVTW